MPQRIARLTVDHPRDEDAAHAHDGPGRGQASLIGLHIEAHVDGVRRATAHDAPRNRRRGSSLRRRPRARHRGASAEHGRRIVIDAVHQRE